MFNSLPRSNRNPVLQLKDQHLYPHWLFICLGVVSYRYMLHNLSLLSTCAQRDLDPEAFWKRDDRPKVASWKSMHQFEWLSSSTYVDRKDEIGRKKCINVTLDWGQLHGELHIPPLHFNIAGFVGSRNLSERPVWMHRRAIWICFTPSSVKAGLYVR